MGKLAERAMLSLAGVFLIGAIVSVVQQWSEFKQILTVPIPFWATLIIMILAFYIGRSQGQIGR